jgi:N-acetylglucosamine-6-sulfatase
MNKDAESEPRTLTRRHFLGASAATLAAPYLLSSCVGGQRNKPNFLFIIVDDMPKWMLEHMPTVLGRIGAEGMVFENFYAAQPLCSPNRATFLTGRYPHNHRLQTNVAAAKTFHESGLDQNTVATDLKSMAGYKTALIGKYFNATGGSERDYVPPGWDRWVSLASAHNPTILANIDGTWADTGVSTTGEARWLSDHADSFIRANEDGPWFCVLSLRAPHGPYTPSADSEHYADDIPLRRTESFGEPDGDGGVSDKPKELRRKALSAARIAKIEATQEGMLEELQDVDREVGRLLDVISSTNQAERTYIIFTSDNGFLFGEHRLVGKDLPYKEASILPLVVRGPGVAPASKCEAAASMVDVRATLANLAGVAGDVAHDGRSLAALFSGTPATWRQRLLLESPPYKKNLGWFALFEPPYIYVEWSTGAKELYDLAADPAELRSLHASRSELVITYSTRLAALKTAQGDALREAEA